MQSQSQCKASVGGRKAYSPTAQTRGQIRHLASVGVRLSDLAIVLGISVKTLRKHFAEELALGAADANFKVADTLFKMATSGKNVSAAIFWAKTRCGFTPKRDWNDS